MAFVLSSAWSLVWVFLWAWVGTGVGDKVPGQLYSSLAHVEALFDFDERLGELLEHLPEHLPAANRYLETYSSLQRDRILGREVRGHPLHVFQLLKRLALFWPSLFPALQTYSRLDTGTCQNLHSECEHWAMRGNCLHYREYMLANCGPACGVCPSPGLKQEVMEVLTKATLTVMPSEDDLRGAAHSLARLQNMYRIPIGNFMAGRIHDTLCSARLSVEDCVRVASATHYFAKYGDAWLWYDYCQATAAGNHSMQEKIIESRDLVEQEHDAKFIDGDVNFLLRPLRESKSQKPWDTEFSKLCRGVRSEVGAPTREFQCHVNSRGSPYLTLQPVRYEQLHDDPEMYLFYDVISDAEISIVKELAREKLSRSTTLGGSGESRSSELRVSHTAWLANQTHPVLIRIAHRISEITQLLTYEDTEERRAGEELQVLNYGIAGYYTYHHDVFFKDKSPEAVSNRPRHFLAGDRLATWIFYLNDVLAGGKTAFPKAGVAVKPVKGAAAFWFNIKRNGDFNFKTEHGGCPVLLGQKWAANRWIRENANFLRRPCSTDPNA